LMGACARCLPASVQNRSHNAKQLSTFVGGARSFNGF
jgi:hypothetical protein